MWLGAAETERIALRKHIMALAHPQFKLALHHIARLFAFVRVLLLGKSLGGKVGNQHFQLFLLRKTHEFVNDAAFIFHTGATFRTRDIALILCAHRLL